MITKKMVGVTKYKELENKYSEFVGSKYAVAVNTGTASLHLALVALGIGQGDEVIVPDFTMSACGFAVAYAGAKVVTVDCDGTLNIDVNLIEEKITPNTKAIMPVHIYGRLCNMEEIYRIAKKHNLFIVEDASEAHGAVYKSKADITCYSFYRNKIIHAEEGGICTTNDRKLYEKMQDLKNMAFGKEHNYYHTQIGFNYRMPEMTAIQVLESLKEYPENAKKRRIVEGYYDKYVKGTIHKRDAVWVYDFFVDNPKKIMENKYARYFFKPLSTMPMFKQEVGKKAQYYSELGVYYIVEPTMTEKDVREIVA
jgi:perosamine synthetase